MLSLFIKIKNAFIYLSHLIFFQQLEKTPVKHIPGTLLLIRLDSIGDFVLLRNFLRLIKKSKKYYNNKITLCGNILWKDLAETLDADYIDEFIWVDRNKFGKNLSYKYNLLRTVRDKGFEAAVDLTFSREILFGDTIIRASGAKEKIGSYGSPESYVKWKRNLFSNQYYSKLIAGSKENIFEYYRNKEFFEKFLDSEIILPELFIDTEKILFNNKPGGEYVVIFPGAALERKRWSIDNFAEVSEFLADNYKFRVIIAGSGGDKGFAEVFLQKIKSRDVLDYTGKTSLSELAKLMAQAKLLISNDTGAVHIAAAVKTPFLCIANGDHYGRFHPYPKEIFDKAYYLYPPLIMKDMRESSDLNEKYRFLSNLDINEIKPADGINILKEIINLL